MPEVWDGPDHPCRASAQPGAAKVSDLLDDAGLRSGIRRCPGCGAELSEAAVLCVMCGYDSRLGRRLKTHVGSAVEADDEDLGELPTHGVEALDKAERQIARDKLEQKRLIKGAPWWMILLAFLGLVGFAVGMVSMPQEDAMMNSGKLLQVVGSLIVAFYVLRILITAFKESVLEGVFSPSFCHRSTVSRGGIAWRGWSFSWRWAARRGAWLSPAVFGADAPSRRAGDEAAATAQRAALSWSCTQRI